MAQIQNYSCWAIPQKQRDLLEGRSGDTDPTLVLPCCQLNLLRGTKTKASFEFPFKSIFFSFVLRDDEKNFLNKACPKKLRQAE